MKPSLAIMLAFSVVSSTAIGSIFWKSPLAKPNYNPDSLATVLEYSAAPDIRSIGDGRINKQMIIDIPNIGNVNMPLKNFTPETGFVIDEETNEVYPNPSASDKEISFSWYGASDSGELSVTVYRGKLTARFSKDTTTWIVAHSESETFFRQIDLARLPEEPYVNVGDKLSAEIGYSAQHSIRKSPRYADAVSILVLYTPNAVAVAGGQSALDSIIHASISNVNQAILNSNVNSVYIENAITSPGQVGLAVGYNEFSNPHPFCIGSACNFLYHRKFAKDNYGSLRDAYAADLVVLLVGDATSCGVAYTQRPDCGADTFDSFCDVGAAYNDFAYSVVSTSPACAVGDNTFVHEVGHQFGLEHGQGDAFSATPSFYWSFGYAIYQPPFVDRDVRVYAIPCGCAGVTLVLWPASGMASLAA